MDFSIMMFVRRCIGQSSPLHQFALILALCAFSFATRLQAMPTDDFAAHRAAFETGLLSSNSDRVFETLEQMRKFDHRGVAELLIAHCLQHDDLSIHKEALEILSRLSDDDARLYIAKVARTAKRWEIRAHCVRIVSIYAGEFGLGELKAAFKDKKWQVRSAAYRGLSRVRRVASVEALVAAIDKERGRLLGDIAYSLERLTGETLDPRDWKTWWATHKDGYEVPRLVELRDKLKQKDGPKSIRTAVKEGLYGPIYSENIAFIIDTSGSMSAGTDAQGTRMEIASRELIRVLENQTTKDTQFNILPFSEEVHPLYPRLFRAKPARVKKAIAAVQQLKAAGETNAFAALEAAFKDADVDTIYFLSDGSPTVGDPSIPELIRMRIEEWNRDRRVIINCIGFFPGDAKHQDKHEAGQFLRELAHENEGFYREIY